MDTVLNHVAAPFVSFVVNLIRGAVPQCSRHDPRPTLPSPTLRAREG